MPIQVFITTEIKDKKGKIIKTTTKKAKSYVKQWMQILEVMTGHAFAAAGGTTSTKDTSGVAKNLAVSGAIESFSVFAIEAPINTTTYGIQVGIGTTAPVVTDHTIETITAHGSGATQLEYGATSVGSASVSGSDMEMSITRAFVNSSGGTITIKEVTIACSMYDGSSQNYFLLLRDAVDDAINDGQTYTVTYTFTTTV